MKRCAAAVDDATAAAAADDDVFRRLTHGRLPRFQLIGWLYLFLMMVCHCCQSG